MRGEIGKKHRKIGSGRIQVAGYFSATVDPYLLKQLKNDDSVATLSREPQQHWQQVHQ